MLSALENFIDDKRFNGVSIEPGHDPCRECTDEVGPEDGGCRFVMIYFARRKIAGNNVQNEIYPWTDVNYLD